jgi:carbon storage regulator CsrA
MLVLSRRPQEIIYFPALGAAVKVVAIRPNVVQLGIDAPPEVAVVRAELVPGGPAGAGDAAKSRSLDQVLQAASAGLGLAQLQLRLGRADEAAKLLDNVQNALARLRRGRRQAGRARAATPQSSA